MILRRRAEGASPNWAAAFEAPPGPDGPAGDHVAGLFAAQDTLRSLADDRGLLAHAVRPVEGVALEASDHLRGCPTDFFEDHLHLSRG